MCDYMHSCFLLHGLPMAVQAMRQQSVAIPEAESAISGSETSCVITCIRAFCCTVCRWLIRPCVSRVSRLVVGSDSCYDPLPL